MTKNVMLRIAFLFAVVCFVNTAVPQKVDAQYALKSQTFYRFRVSNSRCLVPQCDGVTCPSLFAKETLWDNFYMAAPRRQRHSRRTIQNSQESLARMASRYDIKAKTVAKWRWAHNG